MIFGTFLLKWQIEAKNFKQKKILGIQPNHIFSLTCSKSFQTNTCISDLVATSIIDETGIDNTDTVEFSFNSFTFAAIEDTVALVSLNHMTH